MARASRSQPQPSSLRACLAAFLPQRLDPRQLLGHAATTPALGIGEHDVWMLGQDLNPHEPPAGHAEPRRGLPWIGRGQRCCMLNSHRVPSGALLAALDAAVPGRGQRNRPRPCRAGGCRYGRPDGRLRDPQPARPRRVTFSSTGGSCLASSGRPGQGEARPGMWAWRQRVMSGPDEGCPPADADDRDTGCGVVTVGVELRPDCCFIKPVDQQCARVVLPRPGGGQGTSLVQSGQALPVPGPRLQPPRIGGKG